MKLHRYVDHQRLHIVTKDVISLSISVLLLFRHYISHKITFGAPSSGGVLCSACGAFISKNIAGMPSVSKSLDPAQTQHFVLACTRSKLFDNVFNRRQKLPVVRKRANKIP